MFKPKRQRVPLLLAVIIGICIPTRQAMAVDWDLMRAANQLFATFQDLLDCFYKESGPKNLEFERTHQFMDRELYRTSRMLLNSRERRFLWHSVRVQMFDRYREIILRIRKDLPAFPAENDDPQNCGPRTERWLKMPEWNHVDQFVRQHPTPPIPDDFVPEVREPLDVEPLGLPEFYFKDFPSLEREADHRPLFILLLLLTLLTDGAAAPIAASAGIAIAPPKPFVINVLPWPRMEFQIREWVEPKHAAATVEFARSIVRSWTLGSRRIFPASDVEISDRFAAILRDEWPREAKAFTSLLHNDSPIESIEAAYASVARRTAELFVLYSILEARAGTTEILRSEIELCVDFLRAAGKALRSESHLQVVTNTR